MNTLFMLSLQFAKTGLFSVGGGLATLPFLYEISERYGWFTASDVGDMIAISESTPGALGINMSTYAGYITSGIHGGIIATLSLVAPSVVVILVIAQFLAKFKDSRMVKNAFYGLRPASIALITVAGLNVATTAIFNVPAFELTGHLSDLFMWPQIILGVAIFFASRKLKLHPVLYILIAAIVGIILKF